MLHILRAKYKSKYGGCVEMDEIQEQRKFIFGAVLDMANKLQVIGDRYLGLAGMTTKQWLLTVVIEQCGDTPPTLGEVARRMGTSHQNAKQIALKLRNKGFLNIEKDPHDGRTLRLALTPKCHEFWDARTDQDNQFIADLFTGLGEEEILTLHAGIRKLYKNIKKLSEQKTLP
jgi:DNA-binding MarR family transcriptional regulator